MRKFPVDETRDAVGVVDIVVKQSLVDEIEYVAVAVENIVVMYFLVDATWGDALVAVGDIAV